MYLEKKKSPETKIERDDYCKNGYSIAILDSSDTHVVPNQETQKKKEKKFET